MAHIYRLFDRKKDLGKAMQMEWLDQITLERAGAAVAFVLAVLRVFEFVRDRRPSLSVSTSFTTDEDIGNQITLLNASRISAAVHYFSLVWTRRKPWYRRLPFFKSVVTEETPLQGHSCDITVPAHGMAQLVFNEVNHFDWGHKIKDDIYLKVWMVGRRRPKWFWITGPTE